MSKLYDSNHASEILSKLNRERKSNSEYCDVTISVGASKYPAHKCVLRTISTFYGTMFTTEMKEKYENKATIHGISESTMKIIMEFIYTCKILINNKNVYEILEAADYLDIPYLKDFCLEFLISDLTFINCLSIRCYAKKHGHNKLLGACTKMVDEQFDLVLQTEEFKQLDSVADVIAILHQDRQVSTEELVYFGVIAWLKHDTNARHEHLVQLFQMIKLERLTKKFLRKVAAKERILMNSPECTKMILEYLLNHGDADTDTVPQMNTHTGEILIVKGKRVYEFDIINKRLQQIQDTKVDHTNGSAVNFNQEVYLIGGRDTQSVERLLNLENQNMASEWIDAALTKEKRTYAASVVCGSYVYTVGGAVKGWISSSSSLATGERYDSHSNQWSPIRNMKRGRSGHALAVLNNKLYAIGGYDRGCLNLVQCYDPQTEEWTDVPPMKTKRYGLAAVVLDNEIYAIGGQWYHKHLPDVEKYDPVSRKWRRVASLKEARSGHGVCVIKGRIYAIGGEMNDTIEMFDPINNEWTIEDKFEILKGATCIITV